MSFLDELLVLIPRDSLLVGRDALPLARDLSDGTTVGTPIAAVFPTTTGQVSAVLMCAARHGVAVVPQGARTGLAGAANASEGSVLLNLSRMDRILEVDVADQVATVEPGVLTVDLAAAASAKGLFYPPDPGSWESCTIGGNVATNAGGMRCVKYGVTGDFVRQLTVVLASGEVVRTGHRTVKGVSGLDLTSLFVGSEGTLGVVTEITVALLPMPAEPVGVAAAFPEAADALAAADRIMASNRRPSILEFLDGVSIAAINAFDPESRLPAGSGALLLIQSDAPGAAADDAQAFAQIAAECRASAVEVAVEPAAVASLMRSRRLLHGSIRAIAGASLNEDVSVPRSRLAELLEGVAVIAAELGVVIATAGHIGDGNLHPIVCFDPEDVAGVELAVAAYQRLIALAVSLGGTSSGEHGIGTLKREHLDAELGPGLRALQREVKRALDPAGILNPGKKL